jgi:hypothetical protein
MENKSVELYTSILGANTVAHYNIDGKKICPYFIAPWWEEPWLDIGVDLLNVARGSFFCMPFGGDDTGYNGKVEPVHGSCASENWTMISANDKNEEKTMYIEFSKGRGSIEKELKLIKGQTVFYERNTIKNYSGKYPVAFHPMIKLPDTSGTAHLSIGFVKDCFSAPIQFENPENGGYSLFKNNQQIKDIRKVKTVFGDTEDLTKQPIRIGFEDIILFFNDTNKQIGFTAITFKEEGFVYFQLKNPRKLKNTMLWFSNGGRHYAPWNGRCKSVLGIEDSISFFHYGAKASAEPNFLNEMGYETSILFKEEKEYNFELISGIAKVPSGFQAVESIETKEDGITIIGTDSSKIGVLLDLGFIK